MTERIKADIIDNTNDGITMQKILNSEIPNAMQFDISTGYFDVAGYGLLRERLDEAIKNESFNMRLLLGKEAILPTESSFEKYVRQYRESHESSLSLKASLDETDFTMESKNHTTGLIDLLRHNNVQVRLGAKRFNHSKCYILGNNSVFIGSSNLTVGGMTANYELNAGLYQPGVAEKTREWFDRMWEDATDTKDDLISVLQQSKFGIPPPPFEVYMKMLFEKFKPILGGLDSDIKGNTTLTKFQQDAVRTGMFIISDMGGVIIADATGLGKTNMGIEIIREKILKEGKKVLLIAPAQVLDSMWEEKLKDVDIKVREMLTMEALGRESILDELGKYRNIDMILIDESQNFRSKAANRRINLMKLMSIGKAKQVVLLSATPINNSIMDLYYQLSIITGGNDSYFYKTVGIPDLYRHMRDAANKEGLQHGLDKIQQLLDSVMVRRTRSYIKDVYKDDLINGMKIQFPRHEYRPIRYKMSDLFGNIFEKILDDISSLTMAPYGIEQYNNSLTNEEKSRHKVLAHLQVLLLLKRFESSIEAVKISLANKINMYKYVRQVLEEGKILRVADFNRILMKWNASDDGSDPDRDIDEEEKRGFFLKELEGIEKQKAGKDYDIEQLKKDMDKDLKILDDLLIEIKKITVDTKFNAVRYSILDEHALEKESKKVLIFTEYTATAKYITRELEKVFNARGNTVQCITGNTKPDTRMQYIKRFAPKANLAEDEELKQSEIDILISTEVLAEGQNLQDCNYVINYDLPWNPMRIVQRTGRVDRLTSKYDVIHSRACYPDHSLDKILKLVGKLIYKIGMVGSIVGLGEEVLGETPTPKQFNGTTIRRIEALASGESEKTIEELEHESDVMPSTSPINELSRYVKEKGMDAMGEIPMGRRSGKKDERQGAVLAYLQEKPERRVYFVMYDFKTDNAYVPDDDSDAIRMASCSEDELIHLPMDGEDNRESFEILLDIDTKARDAIKKKNDTVLEHVKNIKKGKQDKHTKNVIRINEIVLDQIRNGFMTQDDGEAVVNIIKSDYVKPWADTLENLLASYERNGDLKVMITGINTIGTRIGLDEKPKIKPVEDAQDVVLKLVGAMFVTGDRFNPDLGKKNLDLY